MVNADLICEGRNLIETIKDRWIEDRLVIFLKETPTEGIFGLSIEVTVVESHVQIIGQRCGKLVSLVNKLIGVVRGICLPAAKSLALGNNACPKVCDDSEIVSAATKCKVQVWVDLLAYIDYSRVGQHELGVDVVSFNSPYSPSIVAMGLETNAHLVLKNIVKSQSEFGSKRGQSAPDCVPGQSDISCPAAKVAQVEWLESSICISEDQSWSKVGLNVVVQQSDMVYPHEVDGDSADRVGCIAVSGMPTALDGNLAAILNRDLENSGYLDGITRLHTASWLNSLSFGIPDCKVWVVVAWMKYRRELSAQLLAL